VLDRSSVTRLMTLTEPHLFLRQARAIRLFRACGSTAIDVDQRRWRPEIEALRCAVVDRNSGQGGFVCLTGCESRLAAAAATATRCATTRRRRGAHFATVSRTMVSTSAPTRKHNHLAVRPVHRGGIQMAPPLLKLGAYRQVAGSRMSV